MYCEKCGTKLYKKFLEHEGMVNYCDTCKSFVFKKANLAVSMIILNHDETKTLYVKQYGTGRFRLVAGYVDPGESLEQAVYREMGEEIGRYPCYIEFNMSKFFEPSQSLLCNFIVKLNCEDVFPNYEIDEYEWVPIENAKEAIKQARLAKVFVDNYFLKRNK